MSSRSPELTQSNQNLSTATINELFPKLYSLAREIFD